MTFRRQVQIFILILYLLLLTAAAFSALTDGPLDFFLRLDPSLALVTWIGARAFPLALIPALAVILSGPIWGRVFCGYICPLGITLDGGDRLVGPKKRPRPQPAHLPAVKYLVLAALIGAALVGVSWVFWAAPLSLATRFYGLVLNPALAFIGDRIQVLLMPLAESLDLRTILYAQFHPPRYSTQFFILFFLAVLFGLARYSPRFWCRYLCPSGAILALGSGKPLIRRRVSDACTECGLCSRKCPMNAIPGQNPQATRHSECIVCHTCRDVCPEKAVSFRTGPDKASDKTGSQEPEFSPGRRRFVLAGLGGAATALVGLTGLAGPYEEEAEGRVAPPELLRPPGARPETEFLSRCVRCGECMVVCPTNTLQPLWFKAGPLGLFSPAITPRRGYCDPLCNLCGQVCPTEAIRPLSLAERPWAKTGTARINRQACLAWEHQKSCMVCDEVCPFDAIEFKKEPDNPVAVPHVIEDKCAGCGKCEHFCPVKNRAAIVVSTMGEIRLAEGSYQEYAVSRGLNLTLKPEGPAPGYPPSEEPPAQDLAPGFTE